MSDISKVKLPSNEVYDIKDSTARSGLANVYTKTEVNNLIEDLVGVQFSSPYASVSALPATGDSSTIYLVSNSDSEDNYYDEYLWISNRYELIGHTKVDLSGYATITYVNNSIPTNVSDLTNDAGYLTLSDLPIYDGSYH